MEIVLGRTHNPLYSVTALLLYLSIRGNCSMVFCFLFADGRPLTKARFISKVREALSHRGINSSKYAAHSFCIGAATAAGANVIHDSIIQILGRWQSSAYIQTPRVQLASYSAIGL